MMILLVLGCADSGTGAMDGGHDQGKNRDGGGQDKDKGQVDTGGADGGSPETAPPDAALADALPPLALKPQLIINSDPTSTHGHATILPGTSLNFASVVNCPPAYGCTYYWDFGDGTQGLGIKPPPVTYNKAGLHRVTLKVRDSNGLLLGNAGGAVTVWTGKHSDSFARTLMEWDQHLWLRPVDLMTPYSILGGWLTTKHNKGLPGATALVASPLCAETHLQVTLRRHPVATVAHTANILLRVHPGDRSGRYYRVQITQGSAATGSELALDVFKVTSSQDQLGVSITPSPALLSNFDPARTQDIRLSVDLNDGPGGVPTFHVSAAAASAPSTQLLQLSGVTDSSSTPHVHAGFAGLSHHTGESFFDDFVLTSAVTVPLGAGAVDARPMDAGPPDQAMPDMGLPPDAATPDTTLPDAAIPDAALPDLVLPDQAVPDAMAPDLAMPDTQPAPDLPQPDLGTLPTVVPTITINGTNIGFATITPGTALSFAAVVNCPAPHTCLYKWVFGNGATGTGVQPAAVTYAQPGMLHVKLTVTDSGGQTMGTATALVTVWSGTMSDTFNRAKLDWTKDLWIKPLDANAVFSIKSNWLHVTHNLQAPGSSAILAGPLVKDVHVEVTVKRSPLTSVVHYSDVILRMHPSKLAGSFYRVRIKEGVAQYNNEIDLEIFKIISAADEHGISLVAAPPTLGGFDPTRTTDIRVIIDLQDDASGIPTFDVVFADASNTSKILLQLKGLKDTDTTAPAHAYPGFVGLTQYDGETSFDNFTMKTLTP